MKSKTLFARRQIPPSSAAALLWGLLLCPLATPALAQVYPFTGDSNYTLINNCNAIPNLTVSLTVTEDMLSYVSGGTENVSIANGGFALQVNAAPPNYNTALTWMQYGIIIEADQALGFVQYFDPAGVINHNQPTIVPLPSNLIVAGSVLTISLGTDSSGNVNSITYKVAQDTNIFTLNMSLPQYSSNNAPILVPIMAFQADVVGPINWENANFSSGAGYLTYSSSAGPLQVQGAFCSSAGESMEYAGTGETSNVQYGPVVAGPASTLVQTFSTPNSGALASNMDTNNSVMRVYRQIDSHNQFDLNEYNFNGLWSSQNVSLASILPPGSVNTPLLAYQNTIYGAPEVFYLTPNGASNQVEQLWGTGWWANSLTELASAQPAGVNSALAGYIDSNAYSDNVFYQGTDQHIHLLTWSPGLPWSEDTHLLSAPVAAFGTALTGHATSNTDEIFYVGANNHLIEAWRWSVNFDGWHVTDLTVATGASAPAYGTPLASLYDGPATTDALFYMGSDYEVHALLFKGSWRAVNVTGLSAAPTVAAGTSLAAHWNDMTGAAEVFVTNSDQTIEEMWTFGFNTWSSTNVSRSVGPSVNGLQLMPPPPVNPGTPLAVSLNTVLAAGSDDVYYVAPTATSTCCLGRRAMAGRLRHPSHAFYSDHRKPRLYGCWKLTRTIGDLRPMPS